jgi:hypothetical protein
MPDSETEIVVCACQTTKKKRNRRGGVSDTRCIIFTRKNGLQKISLVIS